MEAGHQLYCWRISVSMEVLKDNILTVGSLFHASVTAGKSFPKVMGAVLVFDFENISTGIYKMMPRCLLGRGG